jgi:anti-sigma factor RsiW
MIAEEVEFQISQYVDGTLPAAEMKYVDDLVQSDPEAQKVLADYRRLNGQLAQLRTGSAVKWDLLAAQISN